LDSANGFVINVRDYSSSSYYKPFHWYGGYYRDQNSNKVKSSANGYGLVMNQGNINKFRIQCAAGTGLAGGTVRIYGVN
jgi:hypothetical protein